ncbi:histidine kinase N-terminal 7TM domain-containing protein [Halosimplex marinum]|uniref:histidine kinase N-terminal 7TM domain-containing protein n=1 Tax=Halosimplex marinum TaxID=3396620 RepID=UPI003F56C76C
MAVATWVLVVLVCSVASTAALAVAGWGNRRVVGVDWFVATMALTTLWTALTVVKVLVHVRPVQLFAHLTVTAAAVAVPVVWFSFVVEYTGHGTLLDARGLAALWAVPGAALLGVVSSPVTDLYYARFRFVDHGGGVVIEAAPGPLAWVNLAYAVVLLVAGLWLVARMLWEHDRLYSGQAAGLLLGSVAPVALLVPAVLDLLPPEVPAIALGFSVLGVGYGYSLFEHRLFDLTPASRRIGVPEAFDDLGEGVAVVDTDGDVVAVNERACELFDCRRGAVLGEPLAAVSAALDGLDAGTTDVRSGRRVLSVSVSTVRDARDRSTGRALVVRDVTEDRRRQQRLNVLDRVFRHNIRNAMNAVVGPAAMLADRVDERDRELARTVADAGREVVALSESVRDIEDAMGRPVEPADVSVGRLVDDALAAVDPPDVVETTVDLPDGPTLRTDPRTLSLVVRNAVANAVEHGTDETGRVAVSADRRADGWLLRVADDGPGIPRAELDVLRAGTETQLAHGSGLGLWAIHWGVTRVGGAVRFETDDGTRVTLWVPELPGDGRDISGAPVPEDVHDGDWFGVDPADPDLRSRPSAGAPDRPAN